MCGGGGGMLLQNVQLGPLATNRGRMPPCPPPLNPELIYSLGPYSKGIFSSQGPFPPPVPPVLLLAGETTKGPVFWEDE